MQDGLTVAREALRKAAARSREEAATSRKVEAFCRRHEAFEMARDKGQEATGWDSLAEECERALTLLEAD